MADVDTDLLGTEVSQAGVSGAKDEPKALTAAELEAWRKEVIEEARRAAQSQTDRSTAAAMKKFSQEAGAIDSIAKREGWDAKKTAEAKRAAWDEALMTEAVAPQAQPAPQTTPQVDMRAEHKKALEAHVQRVYGIAPGQFDVTPWIGISDPNDPRVEKMYEAARAKLAGTPSRDQRDTDLLQAVEEGNLAPLDLGGQPPSPNQIADIDDPDVLWRMANRPQKRR